MRRSAQGPAPAPAPLPGQSLAFASPCGSSARAHRALRATPRSFRRPRLRPPPPAGELCSTFFYSQPLEPCLAFLGTAAGRC